MVGIELLQLQVELYKSAPSGSLSYTFMLVMIALLVGKGAKCPNDSLGSLKSSFSFLCVQMHEIISPFSLSLFRT